MWAAANTTEVETVIPNGSAAEDSMNGDGQMDTAGFTPLKHSESNLTANSAYFTQRDASEDLRFVSQPKLMPQLDRFPNYVYKTAQHPSFVYLLGLGIAMPSLEYYQHNVEWVYTTAARFVGKDTQTDDSVSWQHTACASKAAGGKYGVAKDATLVAVKMPDYSFSSILEGFDATFRHISRHHRGSSAVLLIPFMSYRISDSLSYPVWTHAERMLQALASMGVVIVCAAGDQASRSRTVDTAPAIFSQRTPMVVVSSCDMRGVPLPSTQRMIGDHGMFAPGRDIQCLGGEGLFRRSGSALCKLI
ncbi:MAG: hypothetical protein Q9174_003372 [Haloplaca sp. 1 TL-2023]